MWQIKAFINKIKNREQGAVVAEATIALTAFVFAIYMILSIVDICYIQAKMGIALNAAAKEMSQYAYIYDVLDLYKLDGEGGKSSEFMEGFSTLLNKLSKGTSNLSSDVSSMFSDAGDQAANDDLAEYGKNVVGMALAKKCMKKNLVSFDGDSPEAFLRRCHVKDGLDGLSFLNTTFLTDENQSEINLIVAYKVEVVRLLNTEYTFNFVQRADTKAWGKGVSLVGDSESGSTGSTESKSSIWDAGNLSRGNSIITSEKKNYSYTSSSNNFHAYDSSKNQFIRIGSIDTFADSYVNNPGQIESSIKQIYSTLYSGVENLGEDVSVKNSSGKDTNVKSNKDTRTYKVVIVVPDSADMETVNTAVNNFKAKNPGVEVEVKTGYGNPSSATKAETNTNDSTDTTEKAA